MDDCERRNMGLGVGSEYGNISYKDNIAVIFPSSLLTTRKIRQVSGVQAMA